MASTSQLQAIVERIKEQTRKKHPGVDIMRKPPKPKKLTKKRLKEVN